MTDVTQGRIRTVLFGLLLPIARILLRCGVGYTEFADLAKRAFVEAASADYGVRNRPTNIARVAVMTGLSRKEVSRIRTESAIRDRASPLPRSIPAEVLSYWHTNSNFVSANGKPAPLSFQGEVSFTSLVRSITNDIPARTIERELARVGALKIVSDRKLIPTTREFVPHGVNDKLIEGLYFGLGKLADTVCFNTGAEILGAPYLQRVVDITGIAASDVEEVRNNMTAMAVSFMHQLDDYLTSVQCGKQAAVETEYNLGIGLYYFQTENSRDTG
ncbi:MAG: hypothetical protein H3C57_03100 [Gammaproteobacteria bacterium]|nr:hypothetical protein [Gammaproteobacteria bacterium]